MRSHPFDTNADLWIIYGRVAREMFRTPDPPDPVKVAAVLLSEPALLVQAIDQMETLAAKLKQLAKEGIEQ